MNIEPITEHNIEKLQVTVQICEEHVFPFNKTHFVSPFYKRVIFSSPGQSLSSREALYLNITLRSKLEGFPRPVERFQRETESARPKFTRLRSFSFKNGIRQGIPKVIPHANRRIAGESPARSLAISIPFPDISTIDGALHSCGNALRHPRPVGLRHRRRASAVRPTVKRITDCT